MATRATPCPMRAPMSGELPADPAGLRGVASATSAVIDGRANGSNPEIMVVAVKSGALDRPLHTVRA